MEKKNFRFHENPEVEASAVEEYKQIAGFLFHNRLDKLEDLQIELGDELNSINEKNKERLELFQNLITKIDRIKEIRKSFSDLSNTAKDLGDVENIQSDLEAGQFDDFVKESLVNVELGQNELFKIKKAISLEELMILQTFIGSVESHKNQVA